ncbi:MAG: ABC transporter permease [Chloroflexia bacterium]|nr:ABC transporter permease [Chloroflexia bacterium]MDQ3412997.1 ABC transporter permease [Chloroflexota bacterium]
MGRYVSRRLLLLVVQVILVATVVFLLIRLVPGDPARAILGETASEEQVARVRTLLGIDRPIHEQYVSWIGRVARGDFGTSVISGRPVMLDIQQRIGNTVELIALSTIVSLLIGIPLGIVAALRANRATDYALSSFAMLGLSLPSFVVGTIMLLVFGLMLRWLPPAQFVPWYVDPGQHLRVIILPVIALSLSSVAVVLRMTRSSMLEVIRQDYIRTARAKGLSGRLVILRHALRNSLNPVVSIVGLELAALLGGTVIVESIFNWPGLSSLLIAGVRSRDYPVVQGVVLLIAVLTVLINLLVDLVYGWLDPRISYA